MEEKPNRLSSVGKWSLGVLGATVIFAAQTRPEDATSSIAAWLHWIGIDQVPTVLATAPADTWATVVGALGVLSAVLFWWRGKLRSRGEITVGSIPETAPEVWSVQDDADLQERKRVEDEQGFHDEWEYRKEEQESPNKVERDKALGQALAYHVEGSWGVEFFDSLKAGHDPGGALERVVQLSYDGELTVWGKRFEAGVYEIIPKEYWADHHIDLFSLMRRKAKTVANSQAAGDALYFDLMVSRAQFEGVMPCDVEAIRARALDEGNTSVRASAEPSLYELWRAHDQLHLYQAACLWVGLSPPNDEEAQLPPQAIPMLHQLKKAIIDEHLPLANDPQGTKFLMMVATPKAARRFSGTPVIIQSSVEVSRAGLRAFAESIGERPAFLFGEDE